MDQRPGGRIHCGSFKFFDTIGGELIAFCEAAFSQSGRVIKAFPEFPNRLDYLWEWFLELNATRQSGMSANPISWSEIEAFSQGLGLTIKPWERRLLRQLDIAVLAVSQNIKKSKDTGQPQAKMEVEAADGAGVLSLLRGFGKIRKE